MIDSDRKESGWQIVITVAVVVLALLASGFLIYLAERKVAVEKKVEDKFWTDPNMPKPTPRFAPFEE